MDENLLISEYHKQYKTYVEYVGVVKQLLENLLKLNEIPYLQVQARVKDINSFRKNINENKYKDKEVKTIFELIDLAGCRIIFYLDRDLEKFKKIISNEFINRDQKNKWSKNEYNAYHFIITLSNNRSSLPEYKKFNELLCEIQLTTVIYHAWNELEHDPFYKDTLNLKSTYPKQFDRLKSISKDVMEKQLITAQDTWEYLYSQYEAMSNGKSLFSNLGELGSCGDNNKIYHELISLKSITSELNEIPIIVDYHELLRDFNQIIKNCKTNKPKKNKTIFGYFDGRLPSEIIKVILEIVKYLGLNKDVFNFYIQIYTKENKTSKENILISILNFCEYRNSILNNYGFIIQEDVLKQFKSWDIEKRKQLTDVICEVAKQVFVFDFRDFNTEYNEEVGIQMHLNPITLKNTKSLEQLRSGYIRLLINLYKYTKTYDKRLKIIEALGEATRPSSSHNDTDDIVIKNIGTILKFYIKIIPTTKFEIVKEIDKQSQIILFQKPEKNKNLLSTLENTISKLTEYCIFKILVGYDRDYSYKADWDKIRVFRNNEINIYISQINNSNWKHWERRIFNIAKTHTHIVNVGEYQYFNKFLLELSKAHPKYAKKLLNSNNKHLQAFSPYILLGLISSKDSKYGNKKLEECIQSPDKIIIGLKTLLMDSTERKKLLNLAYEKSKLIKDKSQRNETLNLMLRKMDFNYSISKKLFLDIITDLSRSNNHFWINLFYGKKENEKTIFDKLSLKDWDIVLKSLILVPRIDYNLEYVLEIVGNKSPAKLIQFFRNRIDLESHTKKIDSTYTAIPHELRRLASTLSNVEQEITEEIFNWFKKEDLKWRGVTLLNSLYPNFSQQLVRKLNQIIDAKSAEELEQFILPFFQWYQGAKIEGLVLRIVEKFPKDEKLWNKLMVYLGTLGSLSGSTNEPIFVNAYERKLKDISNWNTKNKKIKEFSILYTQYLEEHIKVETKEHLRDLEKLRKEFQ